MKDYEYGIIPKRYFDFKAIDMSPIICTFPPDMRAIEFFRYFMSGPVNRPIYCAFANGPVANIFLGQGFSFNFRPSGFLVRAFPKEKPVLGRSFLESLDDFWARYLKPEQRTKNPINGWLLELCSFPFLNAANYLRLRGDMSRWDDLYDKALSLIQEKQWLGEEWAKRAEGDLAAGNKPLALGAYEMSALEFLNAGQLEKGVESLRKAAALDPPNQNLRRILENLESSK
jgi:tetratricopeptide (TPR) repeat protein